MRALILYFVLCCLLPFSAQAAESPLQALSALQHAMDANDQALLEKHLDLRGIITRGVDLFVADFAANPPGGEGDPLLEMLSGGLSQSSGTAGQQSLKLLLVEETRKFVLWGVASGNFSGHPSSGPVPDGGILSSLFANASTARKELRSVRCAAPQGTTTTASATFYDHGSERAYPVRLGLTRQPQGYWKVTSVANLAELIRTVRQEAEAR